MHKRGSHKGRNILVAFGVLFLIYILLAYMNYVPFPFINQATAYPNSTYMTDISLNTILDVVGDSEANVLNSIQSDINIEIRAADDVTAAEVFGWIVDDNQQNRWELQDSDYEKGRDWIAYYGLWTKGIMANGVIVVGGDIVEDYTGHDVVIATALADYLTLYRAMKEIS